MDIAGKDLSKLCKEFAVSASSSHSLSPPSLKSISSFSTSCCCCSNASFQQLQEVGGCTVHDTSCDQKIEDENADEHNIISNENDDNDDDRATAKPQLLFHRIVASKQFCKPHMVEQYLQDRYEQQQQHHYHRHPYPNPSQGDTNSSSSSSSSRTHRHTHRSCCCRRHRSTCPYGSIPSWSRDVPSSVLDDQDPTIGATPLHIVAYRNPSQLNTIIKQMLEWEQRNEHYDIDCHHDCQDNGDGDDQNDPRRQLSPVRPSPPPRQRPSLTSIPLYKCQSYPLHIVCGQNLTIDEDVVWTLVNGVGNGNNNNGNNSYEDCPSSLSSSMSVVLEEDVNGDTPLSLLWKNTCRFRWMASIMDGSTTYIDYIEENQSSWMTIISPMQFVRLSKFLIDTTLRYQYHRQQQSSSSTSDHTVNHCKTDGNGDKNNSISLHDLCGIDRLPPVIYQLYQSKIYNDTLKVMGNARTLDEHGRLPLHVAVQCRPASYKFVPSFISQTVRKSIVGHLLNEYPDAVHVPDPTCHGRLPLHHALACGYVEEEDLLHMLTLHPDSLRIQDPVTQLYPFMLVAPNMVTRSIPSSPLKSLTTPTAAMKLKKNTNDNNNDNDSEDERDHWKDDHIRMTFHLLQLCPDAVRFSSCFSTTSSSLNRNDKIHELLHHCQQGTDTTTATVVG